MVRYTDDTRCEKSLRSILVIGNAVFCVSTSVSVASKSKLM